MADTGNSRDFGGPVCLLQANGRWVGKLIMWRATVLDEGGGFVLTAQRCDVADEYWKLPPFLRPPLEVHIPWGMGTLVAEVTIQADGSLRGNQRPYLLKGGKVWRGS